MAKTPSFNFGANVRPKKSKAGGKSRKGKASGKGKSNAWASYAGSARPTRPF